MTGVSSRPTWGRRWPVRTSTLLPSCLSVESPVNHVFISGDHQFTSAVIIIEVPPLRFSWSTALLLCNMLNNNNAFISPIAEFPVEPRLSKVLLSSFDFGCTEEVLTVVALLQVQNLWGNTKGRYVSLLYLYAPHCRVLGGHSYMDSLP